MKCIYNILSYCLVPCLYIEGKGFENFLEILLFRCLGLVSFCPGKFRKFFLKIGHVFVYIIYYRDYIGNFFIWHRQWIGSFLRNQRSMLSIASISQSNSHSCTQALYSTTYAKLKNYIFQIFLLAAVYFVRNATTSICLKHLLRYKTPSGATEFFHGLNV